MNVVYLGWRKAMELKRWILRVQRAQQVFIPIDAEIRMQPALHQDARAAQRDCLVDFLANLFDRAYISVGRARAAIKRAEGANYVADIRVVDVAIDDVGNNIVRMPALANFIGSHADCCNIMRFEQRCALFRGQPNVGKRTFENRFDVSHILQISLTEYYPCFLQIQRLEPWDKAMFMSQVIVKLQAFAQIVVQKESNILSQIDFQFAARKFQALFIRVDDFISVR
jgi:hypothetical protein